MRGRSSLFLYNLLFYSLILLFSSYLYFITSF
nr:MAG TPA: PsbL protein [Bacteriophage sp.]